MTNPGLWCPPATFDSHHRRRRSTPLCNHHLKSIQAHSRMEEDMTNPGLSCPLPCITRHTIWNCQ